MSPLPRSYARCTAPAPAPRGAPGPVRRPVRPGRFPALDDTEAAFARLAGDPGLLVRTPLGPLPPAPLRSLLTDPATSPTVRDSVWRTLIGRARGDGGVWLLVGVGCALPKLRSIAWHTTRNPHTDRGEVAQELLASFTHALLRLDPIPQQDVFGDLARAARGPAQHLADRARQVQRTHAPTPGPTAPPPPTGHPDLVLAELVRTGVIDRAEADLIGRHRLDGISLRRIAHEFGWYPMQATRRLRAAEHRVIAALAPTP
jgi:hypothetical protein